MKRKTAVFVLIFVALLGAYWWFVPWRRPGVSVFERQKQELDQFQGAIERYKDQFSDYPPDSSKEQIALHLLKSYPTIDVEVFMKNHGRELGSLDERETLHFWLEGPTWQLFTGQKEPRFMMFEFDSTRLVDNDNDGWLEYVDRSGNYFVLRRGKPMIIDRTSFHIILDNQ